MKKGNSYLDWIIFRKAVNDDLTSGEKESFEKWLGQNRDNEVFFNKARRYYEKYDSSEIMPGYDSGKAWSSFEKYARKEKRLPLRRWSIAAASLAILISTGLLIFNSVRSRESLTASVPEQIIEPGKSIAKLTFDDGKIVYLENQDTLISFDGSETIISIQKGEINYKESEKSGKNTAIRYNKIEIPHGGEYHVTLGDGTRVWLNSESMLEYQVPFAPDKREVTLSGEAYFEVTKNVDCPFIVKTDEMDINVLGTVFNISTYPEDNKVITTLVNGSIIIDNIRDMGDAEYMLSPKQQLSLNKETRETSLRTVDPDAYTAWINGSFVFEEETLSDIFGKLARWYDIEVIFQKKSLENEHFSGKLPRFEDFQVILDLMNNVSNTKIELDGSTVIIK